MISSVNSQNTIYTSQGHKVWKALQFFKADVSVLLLHSDTYANKNKLSAFYFGCWYAIVF